MVSEKRDEGRKGRKRRAMWREERKKERSRMEGKKVKEEGKEKEKKGVIHVYPLLSAPISASGNTLASLVPAEVLG